MQSTQLIHNRNQLLFVSYIISLFFHLLGIIFDIFSFQYGYPWYAISYCFAIGLLFYFKIPSRVMQVLLIIGLNFLIVFLIVQSVYVISLFWLIFYILLISLYRSLFLNVAFAVICLVEGLLLFQYKEHFSLFDLSFDMFASYMFFIVLLCCVGIIQTVYTLSLWRQEESKTIKKEEQLMSREAYLKLFFQHSSDAFAVYGRDNKIIEVNPAFEQLYGWTREESIAKTPPIVPPLNLQASQNRFERILKGESFTLFETEDMRKDGTIFDAQISLSPIYDLQGEIIAISVIARDISYIKENERLSMQSEKLRVAGEIAAGVAHEIRNPMTVISGFVQMLSEDAAASEYTKIIQKEIDRIELILEEFLVLSKPQFENFTAINMEAILQDIQALFKLEFEQRQIKVTATTIPKNIHIYGNENQIKQVLINIFKNAMEAIQEDGYITLDASLENEHLTIVIKDTGCGIAPHQLERIFEPFYTTKTKGTGLGMMIINKIIQDHDGTISIQSKVNVGTEISISLPITQKAQA